jgi:hypothetical protein
MMHDIQEPKTFDSPSPLFRLQSLSGKRFQLCAKLLAIFVALIVATFWLPDRPHLYFDLGIALIFIGAIIAIGRYSLRENIERPHADMGSLLHGLGVAGAIYGVLTIALTGDSVGVEEILRLTVGYSIGAVLGAAWLVLIGILVYWPVHVVVRKVFKRNYRQEAATLGLLTGGLALVPVVVMSGMNWAPVAAGLLCGVCAHRAAAIHKRFMRRGLST